MNLKGKTFGQKHSCSESRHWYSLYISQALSKIKSMSFVIWHHAFICIKKFVIQSFAQFCETFIRNCGYLLYVNVFLMQSVIIIYCQSCLKLNIRYAKANALSCNKFLSQLWHWKGFRMMTYDIQYKKIERVHLSNIWSQCQGKRLAVSVCPPSRRGVSCPLSVLSSLPAAYRWLSLSLSLACTIHKLYYSSSLM